MDAPVRLMAGGVEIKAPSAERHQLSMLLWGDSGSGKTTLAATAPGQKLFVLFDPGGDISLVDRSDVAVLDLTGQSPTLIMAAFKTADPYGIDRLLKSRPDIETVVVDSMTTLAYAALQEAVLRAGGERISMEQPGINGYAYRNSLILRAANTLQRICTVNKRHLILVTHEGGGDRDKEGHVISITMALSNNIANQIGLRLNEIWHLSDADKERKIAIRPCRLRKPMKTRLFAANQLEFTWHYDADTQIGEGIADWYHAWQIGGGKKLQVPTRAVATPSRGGKK